MILKKKNRTTRASPVATLVIDILRRAQNTTTSHNIQYKYQQSKKLSPPFQIIEIGFPLLFLSLKKVTIFYVSALSPLLASQLYLLYDFFQSLLQGLQYPSSTYHGLASYNMIALRVQCKKLKTINLHFLPHLLCGLVIIHFTST